MSKVRLVWKSESAHRIDFDLSDAGHREWLARMLDHDSLVWGGETPTEDQIKARMEADDVQHWEAGWRMPQDVVDFLENETNDNTWFDSDSGQIEIRDFDVYEGEEPTDG